jgi:hypothetical protein
MPTFGAPVSDSLTITGRVHFGRMAVNALGFDDRLIPDVLPRQEGTTICAHAPSVLHVSTTRPMQARGFINASGSINHRNPIDFYIDHNIVGSASGPCKYTDWAYIAPGEHRFEAHCTTPAGGRHSVWHLTEATERRIESTAVVTLAMYPSATIKDKLKLLQLSCRQHNVWLHVIGADETFRGWYGSKVLRIGRAIRELPEEIKYILYLDGRDSIVTAPLDQVVNGFIACQRGVVVSAESCCWPCRDEEWIGTFENKPARRNFPCAGVWMGERQSIARAFSVMERIREKLTMLETPDVEVAPLWPYRKYRNDDQFLWQSLYKYKLADVGVDSDCRFSFNVACAGAQIENSQFDFATRTVRTSGTRPGVFHFSSVKRRCMDQWFGLLNS